MDEETAVHEKTPKLAKAIQAVGVICMIFGLVATVFSVGFVMEDGEYVDLSLVCFLFVFIGVLIYSGVQIVLWWQRG